MRIGRRCFVSNLNWKTSWQELKDHFRESGEVVYADVVKDMDGRSKGWGIVEFDCPEAALRAVEKFNGYELGGRKIMVREDREDRDIKNNHFENVDRERPRSIRRPQNSADKRDRKYAQEGASSGLQVVVQGIPWKFTDEDLRSLFDKIGQVVHAEVQIGYNGRSRGFGTVRFATAEEAQDAINAVHGTELESRTLTVKLDRFA